MSTPTQTLYVPHRGGAVLGSHDQAPWLASGLDQATRGRWRGQPVFTDRDAAFGWLDWAGTDRFRSLDLSIAAVAAHTYRAADGLHRVAVDRAALRDPAAQLVRAGPPAPGPHPGVLAAWQVTARVEAGVGWARDLAGGQAAGDGIRGVVDTIWRHAYPVAYRDARTALTDHLVTAVHTLVADLDHRHDPSEAARQSLQRLAGLAIEVTTNPRPGVVPDPPPAVRAAVQVAAGTDLSDWVAAADLAWATAVRTGAVDAIATTAADIYTASRTGQPSTQIRIGGDDLAGWLRTTLGAGNRDIANQWLAAAPVPRPHAPPRAAGPTAGQPPAADRPGHRPGQAFPPLSTVDQRVAPAAPAPTGDPSVPRRGVTR